MGRRTAATLTKEAIMTDIDRDEIVRLTEEYGGQWGISHTRRLLHLISLIGEGQQYNTNAVWLAAHLHDWGGYQPWAEKGVDHALRSKQVAETYLTERGCPEDLKRLVLECIEHHHHGDPNRSPEAILLIDADALDFLGVVGVLRDFSKNPRDLRKGYEAAKKRRATLPAMLCLEKSRDLARQRIQHMDELLARFEADSWGYF
jgi:uncharacterized protein